MAYKIKDGKVVRRLSGGDKIITQTWRACDAEGREVGLCWFVVPDGMSREEAFASQQHHGPFQTDQEVSESQRVVLRIAAVETVSISAAGEEPSPATQRITPRAFALPVQSNGLLRQEIVD
jgi:hypothetical protein